MAIITKIEAKKPIPKLKRVAAYARISEDTDRLIHSLSVQISYYSSLIQRTPGWQYVGVYADNGISGTRIANRDEFKRLINDCEAGKIDIILTKSISRFARNTLDLLETVRRLKDLGIEVRFEKERINSLSDEGELMLSLLASFAQEESRSISENVKWGTRKRFQQGIPNGHFMIYGYRWEGDHLVIQPDEAEIVKLIYDNFLKGLSAETTEKQLEEMGVKSYKGGHFGNTSIRQILRNVTYTGNLLFQKEYVVDPISGKSKINRGELPKYWAENTHEAIIPMEVYQAVQDEIARRRKLGALANWSINTTCLTGKIKCGYCGKSYVRSTRKNRAKCPDENTPERYVTYSCGTRKNKGGRCRGREIREDIIKEKCAVVLGLAEFDEAVFLERIEKIVVVEQGVLDFHMTDGSVVRKEWKSNAKKNCWTEERRKAKGRYVREHQLGPYSTCFTSRIVCEKCGESYRRQGKKSKKGERFGIFYCSKSCGNASIYEDILKDLCAKAMGLSAFDEAAFRERVDHIGIAEGNTLRIYFKDGTTYDGHWQPMQKLWRKRYGKGNKNRE